MMIVTAYHIHQWSLMIIILCFIYNNSSNLVVTAWQQQRRRHHHHHRLGPLLQFDQSTTTAITSSIICCQWKHHQRRSICFVSLLRESKRSLPLQLQQQQDDDDIDDDHYELSDHHHQQHEHHHQQHHHRQRRGLRLMHGIRRTFQRVFGAVASPFHNKKDASTPSSLSQSSSKITTTTTVVTPSSSSSALTEDDDHFDQQHEQQQQQQRGYFHWIRRILHRVYRAMTAPFKKKHALSSHSSVPSTTVATATARFVKDNKEEETIVAPAVNGAAKTNNTVFDGKVLPRRKETAIAAVDGAKTNMALEKEATAQYTKKEEVVNGAAVAETFNMATPPASTQNVTTSASSSHRPPQNQHYHHQPSPPPSPPQQPPQQRRHVSGNEIVVTSSLELPIDAYTAFDAFSDLPRQSSWSPWLHSVEYIHDDSSNNSKRSKQHRKHHHNDQESFSLLFSQENNTPSSSLLPSSSSPLTATPLLDHHPETRWTASFRGFRFSWDAIHTRLERPILIEWESTSGLKNYGQVVFVPNYTAAITPDTTTTTTTTDTTTTSSDVSFNCYPTTLMTLSITFRPPTWLAFLMRSSEKATKFVEERMLRTTLQNFRQALLSEQQQLQEEQQLLPYERATIQSKVETNNT